MKFVVLAIAGGVFGFLVARFVFPLLLERGVLFLVLPMLLVATLLFTRAVRQGRSGP